MVGSELVNLASLLDDAKCFAMVRQHRWPEQVQCPGCDSTVVVRAGHGDSQPHRQRYQCNACGKRLDDLTGTVLAGHHQPLRVWVLCLYFMGLNLSNRQIAQELGLSVSAFVVANDPRAVIIVLTYRPAAWTDAPRPIRANHRRLPP